MPKPKVLTQLGSHIKSEDDPHDTMNWVSAGAESETVEGTEHIDADTLEGHPASYFASTTEVRQAISSYISTVLGTSY